MGAYMVNGLCMGPPPNIHGGCIFTLHTEAVVSCLRLHASAFGSRVGKGMLTRLSVNFRKLTPLWKTYAVRVRIVDCQYDAESFSWSFKLKSEMTNPDSNIVHSDADADFKCCNDGHYDLLLCPDG